jgi:hypothetical protein
MSEDFADPRNWNVRSGLDLRIKNCEYCGSEALNVGRKRSITSFAELIMSSGSK